MFIDNFPTTGWWNGGLDEKKENYNFPKTIECIPLKLQGVFTANYLRGV